MKNICFDLEKAIKSEICLDKQQGSGHDYFYKWKYEEWKRQPVQRLKRNAHVQISFHVQLVQ